MIEIVKENGVPVERIVNKRETPINLKAVGDPEGNEKIYMEDYVDTFIKQIAGKDDDPKVLILYGETAKEEEQTTHFIYGAVLAEDVTLDEKNIFGDTIWKDVNKKAAHFFPNTQIMGWVYIRYDLADFAQEKVLHTHKQFFRSDQKVYIEYSAVEKKENVYLVSNGKPEKQSGHYIYYECNEPMQNYMITVKQEEPEEVKPEVDRAAKKSRAIVREKKEEIKHRQTMGMLYGSSMAMLLVVTIVGITLLNNYNKMQSMEKVLNNISDQMSEGDDATLTLTENENLYAANSESGTLNELENKDVKEDAAAEAEPTEASANEAVTDAKQVEITDDVAANGEQAKIKDDVVPNGEQPDIKDDVVPNGEQPDIKDDATAESEQSKTKEDAAAQADNVSEADFAEPPVNESIAASEPVVPPTYLIQKGDTLSRISIMFYGNENMIDRICELNGIADKNSIKYGINIVLP